MKRIIVVASIVAFGTAIRAQETVEQRLERLERENRDLQQKVEGLGHEVERVQFGGLVPPLGEKRLGFAQGANKVDQAGQGVSIGGYGEFLFTQHSGATDTADALRAILYLGYRFDEHWLFNSEIEIEHGTTEATSGTTGEGGSLSLEFGYVEYAASPMFRARAGVVLLPVGLVNEDHEPTSFLTAMRSQTETRIIPATWGEPGVELLGECGGLTWRGGVFTGFDGERFEAEGLREGRQGGNRAAADDFAGAVRVDWTGTEHLLAGGSVYYGKAGQDNLADSGAGTVGIQALDTTIIEAHVDWRPDRFIVRGLYASGWVQDAGAFDAALGRGLASRLEGYYGELGYDVMPWLALDSKAMLVPFVRYEHIDTQRRLPAGVARDGTLDSEIYTFGLNWRPLPQLAIKADFENWIGNPDQLHVSLGYVF